MVERPFLAKNRETERQRNRESGTAGPSNAFGLDPWEEIKSVFLKISGLFCGG
jgi:hypothetical protein